MVHEVQPPQDATSVRCTAERPDVLSCLVTDGRNTERYLVDGVSVEDSDGAYADNLGGEAHVIYEYENRRTCSVVKDAENNVELQCGYADRGYGSPTIR